MFTIIKKSNVTSEDFTSLGKIKYVKVRVNKPSARWAFWCSVEIYQPDTQERFSEKFRVTNCDNLDNLYIKAQHHIQKSLMHQNVRLEMQDTYVVQDDMIRVEDVIEWYRLYLLGDRDKELEVPTRQSILASKKTGKMMKLCDHVEYFRDHDEVAAGVVEWIKDYHGRTKRNGQPISENTKRIALNEMKGLLRAAYVKDIVPFHVQLDVKRAAVIVLHRRAHESAESSVTRHPFFLVDEVRRMLAVDYKEDTRLAIALGAYTGMRLQEIRNMRWENIIRDKHIHVLKSKMGRQRDIPIMPELLGILKKYRDDGHCYGGLDLVGNKYDDFLFSEKYRDKHHSSIAKNFEMLFRKAGLTSADFDKHSNWVAAVNRSKIRGEKNKIIPYPPRRRFISLRRTFASCMALTNCSSTRLRHILGHTDAQMSDTYSQYLIFMEEVESEKWPAGELQYLKER